MSVTPFGPTPSSLKVARAATPLSRWQRQQRDPPYQRREEPCSFMAADIVQNLTKAGYKAQRLAATDARPSEGLWVHGVFTELSEGNRLQRAVIGFGAGSAKMDLFVTMNDLSRPDKPLYTTAKSGESSKKPGAANSQSPSSRSG